MQKLLVWLGTMIIVGSGIANATANSNLLGSKDPIINNNLSTIQGIKTDVEEVDEYFKDLHKQSSNKSSREKKMFELASDFGRKSVKNIKQWKSSLLVTYLIVW
ncbi:hypothetical protein [Spiroplasma endosymbiont of Glossina fuscipes fuscipes]|uniref:hypothetical protein n=1 Tax=Spiroplasma endosymbiont of Glossina fuscipes fuscipes TaxID=2004463 RepID=UPI003C71BCD3